MLPWAQQATREDLNNHAIDGVAKSSVTWTFSTTSSTFLFTFKPLRFVSGIVLHLEDVGQLALAVGNVSGVPPAEGYDALLQVAERLVDVHAFLLDGFVGDSAPFQPLLITDATICTSSGRIRFKRRLLLYNTAVLY